MSDRTRTGDHLDHNQELYQLSYAHRVGFNLAWTDGNEAGRASAAHRAPSLDGDQPLAAANPVDAVDLGPVEAEATEDAIPRVVERRMRSRPLPTGIAFWSTASGPSSSSGAERPRQDSNLRHSA